MRTIPLLLLVIAGQVAELAPAPSLTVELVRQGAAIITALGLLVTAAGGIVTAIYARKTHTAQREIKATTEKTASQTDGHLKSLLADNKELQVMLRQALAALSGTRVAAAIAQGEATAAAPVRDTGGNGDALQQMDRRHGDRRRAAEKDPTTKEE